MLQSTSGCQSIDPQDMKLATQNRLLWLDVAKGWGSLLVVCGHVMLGLQAAAIIPQQTTFLTPLFQAKYLFNVPLFFVIAGLTVETSLRKGKQAFFLEKVFTLVYPYFLWSIIVVFLQSQAGQSINHPKSMSALQTIWYNPPSPLWMLYSLFICHLVLAALPDSDRSSTMLILSTGALTAMFVIAKVRDIPLVKTDQENLVIQTIYHAWFYALGIKFRELLIKTEGGLARTAASFVVFVSLAAIYLCNTENHSVFSAACLPAALAGIVFVFLSAKTIHGPMARAWGVLGRGSMSIYVMHVIFGAAVRIGLLRIGVTNPVVHFVFGVAFAIFIPLMIHTLLKQMNMLPLLGLARLRPNQGQCHYLPTAEFKNEGLATSE